jgi:hypothetical protein
MKICTKCNSEQPLSEFYKRSNTKSGLHSWCKSCIKEIKSWKTYQRKYSIKKRYGLSLDDYEAMFEAQEGKCKICKTESLVLAIDHCHSTGKIRGLLCDRCNHGLGHFKDDINLLIKAIEYLNTTEKA